MGHRITTKPLGRQTNPFPGRNFSSIAPTLHFYFAQQPSPFVRKRSGQTSSTSEHLACKVDSISVSDSHSFIISWSALSLQVVGCRILISPGNPTSSRPEIQTTNRRGYKQHTSCSLTRYSPPPCFTKTSQPPIKPQQYLSLDRPSIYTG